MTLEASNTVFVGLPLVHLPWPLASAVPFVTAVLSSSLAVALVVWAVSRGRHLSTILVMSAVAPMAWWSYWWLPVTLDPAGTGDPLKLARAVTFWQSINSGYVIPMMLIVAAYVVLTSGRRLPRGVRPSGLVVLGLAIGFTGPVLSVTVLLVFVVLGGLNWLGARNINAAVLRANGILALALVVGAGVSYLAPGTKAGIDSQGSGAPSSISALVQSVFPSALTQWFDLVVNWGSLAVLVLFATASVFVARGGTQISAHLAANMAARFLLLALVMSIANRSAEPFVYQAYWHRVPIAVFVFLSMVAAGTAIGMAIHQKERAFQIVVVAGVLAALPMTVLASGTMAAEVQKRHQSWISGAAPFTSIGDIEDGSGWLKCWLDLGQFRDIPDRVPPGTTVPDRAPIPS